MVQELLNSYFFSYCFCRAGTQFVKKTNNLVKPEEVKALNWDTDHLLIEHQLILTDIINIYNNFIT
jgi:hypothetical protein